MNYKAELVKTFRIFQCWIDKNKHPQIKKILISKLKRPSLGVVITRRNRLMVVLKRKKLKIISQVPHTLARG